jgi:AraC-like DNA-binding protein
MLLEDTGRSLSEHLLERRLDAAAAILRNPAMDHVRIAEVAIAVGFTDISHFNRSFRRKFGDTPSGLRSRA